ncbi:Hypothetical protein SMAX5B_006117 [Scophthalmus maximus]|uniref:Uncharacterized protein n=1 Tax=Scophthalmus maximus TaxID=52904 RepID=A0A2U9BJF9_SCOMX|nr:Hypothetical protein SMAX5B_006117 [Scophthalmus maximus]
MWSHAESVAAQQSNLSMRLAIVKLPPSTSVLRIPREGEETLTIQPSTSSRLGPECCR